MIIKKKKLQIINSMQVKGTIRANGKEIVLNADRNCRKKSKLFNEIEKDLKHYLY